MDSKKPKYKPKTDWERLSKMSDEDIDTSDIPELDEEFFAKAKLRLPERGTQNFAPIY